MFESIENKHVSEIIIEQIQKMIMSGQLKVGDKLPPERELTEILNVGRPALREALKSLEVIGLIKKVHGQGNFITNNLENSFFKPLSLSFKLSNGKIEDILRLRMLIESFTAEEAAKNATDSDINRLSEVVNNMIQSESIEDKATFDKTFHYEIAQLSNNKLIINLFDSISYLMESFIGKSVMVSLLKEHAIEKIYDEHCQILDAIKANDPMNARLSMNSHLSNINISFFKDLD